MRVFLPGWWWSRCPCWRAADRAHIGRMEPICGAGPLTRAGGTPYAARNRGRGRRTGGGAARAALRADAATRACSSSTTSAVGSNGSATTWPSTSEAAATGRPSTRAITTGPAGSAARVEDGELVDDPLVRVGRRGPHGDGARSAHGRAWWTLRGGSPHRADPEPVSGPDPLLRAGPPNARSILRPMRFWSHDRHGFPLPAGHRFPLPKYRLLREAVEREGLGAVRRPRPRRGSCSRRSTTRDYLDARAARRALAPRGARARAAVVAGARRARPALDAGHGPRRARRARRTASA